MRMTQRSFQVAAMMWILGLVALGVLSAVSYLVLAATIACTASPCAGTDRSDRITDIHNGPTTINAGLGNDRITTDNSANVVNGEAGNDVVFLGRSTDTVNGGFGNDTIFGGAGANTLLGQEGNDQIFAEDGADVIGNTDGTAGCADTDEPGNDRIDAGSGADGTAAQPICGGAGNDQINGGDGNDFLSGNSGNDRLSGGPGTDTVTGGGGNDIYFFRRGDMSAGDEALTCTTSTTDRSTVVLIGFNREHLPVGLAPGVIVGTTPEIPDPPGATTGLTITAGTGRCTLVLRSR